MPNMSRRSRQDNNAVEESVVAHNVAEEEISSDESVDGATFQNAKPFADGLVSARLNGLVVIPRAGGEEVELLRGFLRHFSSTYPFAGNIVTKASFMRKKGGRLL